MSTHARFFDLLAKIPFADKKELVWQYSNMLTNSLSEFRSKDPAGYSRMIEDLQKLVNNMNNKPQPDGEKRIKELRSAILHRLQKHGVDTTNWAKVNAFMEQPRIAGKRLYDMTEAEMQALIPKLEAILTKDKAKQAETKRLTQLN